MARHMLTRVDRAVMAAVCSVCGPTRVVRHGRARSGGAFPVKCRAVDLAKASRNNPRKNAISAIAYRIAGGHPAFYRLPRSERLTLRERAAELHRLGATVALAAKREADKTPDGFVYIVSNPAWPGAYKLGMAVDAESRLDGYQTSSPHRDYALEYAVYVKDRAVAEAAVHERLKEYRLEGEWFAVPLAQARAALDAVKEAA